MFRDLDTKPKKTTTLDNGKIYETQAIWSAYILYDPYSQLARRHQWQQWSHQTLLTQEN